MRYFKIKDEINVKIIVKENKGFRNINPSLHAHKAFLRL